MRAIDPWHEGPVLVLDAVHRGVAPTAQRVQVLLELVREAQRRVKLVDAVTRVELRRQLARRAAVDGREGVIDVVPTLLDLTREALPAPLLLVRLRQLRSADELLAR